MKHKQIILILLLFFTISSCKKDLLVKQEEPLRLKLNTKEMSTRPLPPGDPNLDSTWDFTQQNWLVYFNNSNGTVGSVSTLNPFLDASQKVFGNVNSTNADIYPAKGWTLVARDFGTPLVANAYPFIVLYNKYRGVLRVCMLRTYDVLSSYQQISLSFVPNSSYPQLFKYDTGVVTTADTKQVAITTAGVQEWMIADFDVRGYDPMIDDNSAFNISMAEVAQSNIILNGNISLDGTAQPKVGTPSPLSVIQSVYNFGVSTAEAAKKVIPVKEPQTPAEIETAFGQGINVFFNTVFKLFTGFSGGGAGSTYDIKLKGKVDLAGAITLTSPKTTFAIFLKPLPNLVGYKALQNISWGVFNMGNIPMASNEIIDNYDWIPNGDGDPTQVYTGYMRDVNLNPNFITNANFIINPTIAADVSNIEFSYTTIFQDYNTNNPDPGYYSPFLPKAQFEANALNLFSHNSTTINLNVKITFNNGAIVYQVIPI